MNPLLKLVVIIVVAWVLVTQFVPLIIGVPTIVITLVTLAIVLGAVWAGWQIIEKL